MEYFRLYDHTNETSEPDFDPRLNGWRIKHRHWHFHKQLHERYRVILEYGEFSELSRAIRSGRAELIEFQPGRGAIYAVMLARCWTRIFVATKGDEIVTALPLKPQLVRKWRRLHNR